MKKKKKTNPQLIFSNHVLLPSHKKIGSTTMCNAKNFKTQNYPN